MQLANDPWTTSGIHISYSLLPDAFESRVNLRTVQHMTVLVTSLEVACSKFTPSQSSRRSMQVTIYNKCAEGQNRGCQTIKQAI